MTAPPASSAAASSPLAATIGWLDDTAAERSLFAGYQLAVVLDGAVVCCAAGGVDALERPIAPRSLLAVYCTGKPIVALAVIAAIEAGEIRLDDAIGSWVEGIEHPRTAALTVRQLLTHTAGLGQPGIEARITPAAQRDDLARRARLPDGFRPGIDAAYSEFTAWHLLAMALERASGAPLHQLVSATSQRWGFGDDIVLCPDPATAGAAAPRVAPNVQLHGGRFVPMLGEVVPGVIGEWNPAMGAYATAGGLARLYWSMLDRLHRGGAPALAEATTPQRLATADPVLGRRCSFGFGFMTDLAGHGFSDRCSPRSFGHSGNAGMSFALADPDHGLAIAYIGNGFTDAESLVGYHRPALVGRCYAALGLG